MWQVPVTAPSPGLAVAAPGAAAHPALEVANEITMSDEGGVIGTITNDTESVQIPWLADTTIVFPPGSGKMSLTSQAVMVKIVLHEAMEIVRADLLFKVAFPNPNVTLELIKESLITAASHLRGAANIYRCLLYDAWYMSKMVVLVSLRNPNMNILTLLTAMCPNSTLPRGSQRVLQRNYLI